MGTALQFYLDENLPPKLAEQLRRHGIDAVSVHDLGYLGDSDESHLSRATEMGYVLCTYDQDFLKMARDGIEHAGIVFGHPNRHGIGDWVRGLELVASLYTPEQMKNLVEFI